MAIRQIQRIRKVGSKLVPKKIIRLTPDQMGYQDRGKMKWQGLILSDHTEAIKKTSQIKQNQDLPVKDQLSLEDIGKKLAYAYQKKLPICLQTSILKKNSSFQEYYCQVAGDYVNEIYFSLKSGKMMKTSLENIRHLELLNPALWQLHDY